MTACIMSMPKINRHPPKTVPLAFPALPAATKLIVPMKMVYAMRLILSTYSVVYMKKKPVRDLKTACFRGFEKRSKKVKIMLAFLGTGSYNTKCALERALQKALDQLSGRPKKLSKK